MYKIITSTGSTSIEAINALERAVKFHMKSEKLTPIGGVCVVYDPNSLITLFTACQAFIKED